MRRNLQASKKDYPQQANFSDRSGVELKNLGKSVSPPGLHISLEKRGSPEESAGREL